MFLLEGSSNIGAIISRIGFWGIFCSGYDKEPPENSIGNYLGPYLRNLIKKLRVFIAALYVDPNLSVGVSNQVSSRSFGLCIPKRLHIHYFFWH